MKLNTTLPGGLTVEFEYDEDHLIELISVEDKFGNDIELMVGNIANPNTYRKYCELGVDYVRVGIGGGSVGTIIVGIIGFLIQRRRKKKKENGGKS